MMAQVRLRHDNAKSVERRHPWLFSGALEPADLQALQEGDPVEVVTHAGDFVGRGYFEAGSIAVRLLTFDPKTVIDDDFWQTRVERACRLRESLGLTAPRAAFRLINGEGDGLPGLVVDLYDRVAVVQAHTMGMHRQRARIADALTRVLGSRLTGIYYKSSATLATHSTVTEPLDMLIYGELPEELTIVEGEVTFAPDLVRGQKSGLFLDQRENRLLLRRYAQGRSVLDLFCYSGGFSLHAMQGGAARVTSVDSSAIATAQLEQNLRLNPALRQTAHDICTGDAFAFLDDMPAGAYDLIVLDPPAFANKRSALTNALHGYRRINTRALEKVAPGGLLFTFSCSQALSSEVFRQNIFTSALAARRKVRVLHQLTQAPDLPVSIYHPEGDYLKGLVLYVE